LFWASGKLEFPTIFTFKPSSLIHCNYRPDVEESFNKDLKAITDVAQQYADTIYAVTVGSETLYRGNFTGEELADKIKTVKSKLPSGIKVGTADSWNKFADGTGDAIIGTADIIMVNAFAFWQGASRENATYVSPVDSEKYNVY
jgi:exo-beta-1,3-glucanase (GH17 family)